MQIGSDSKPKEKLNAVPSSDRRVTVLQSHTPLLNAESVGKVMGCIHPGLQVEANEDEEPKTSEHAQRHSLQTQGQRS